MIIVASERAARAAAFEGEDATSIDRWLAQLADALDPNVTEATWLEEILFAADVIRARGGNPSVELARGVVSLLRRCDEADLDPKKAPGGELAGDLARLLAANKKRARGAAARLIASCLHDQPLFARSLSLPDRIVLRDVVRLTPARLRLFRLLSPRLVVDLTLVERPLGGSDALGRIGDLYAEALDGPPSFRAVPEEKLAPCTHHPEADPDAALARAMALVAASLDAGASPDACGLAWPSVLSDPGLRALAHAARAARVPVLAERRATSARSIDELLRWCELLAGELRFDELLALLRSPLLELDVAEDEPRLAIRRLIDAPLRRGPSREVLAEVATAEAGQPGAAVYEILAALAARLSDSCTMHESAQAIGEALEVLGLARGASRGGTAVFRADAWPDAADRALLASIAGEERALATFESLRSALVSLTAPRRAVDLVRDLRQLLEAQAPRMAGNPGSVRTGSLGALATERVRHVVVPDASYEAWHSRHDDVVPALVAVDRLAALAVEAELVLLRLQATQVDVITSSGDARGEPQRLHPMFESAVAIDPPRLVLAESEVLARTKPSPAVAERIRRQRAREAWRGDDDTREADALVGRLPGGLPWLATEQKPLSPHAAEQFVACPYRGFVVQELRARAETDADSVADPTEEGRILHDLLEHAFLAARGELERPEPDGRRVRELGEAAALERATRLLVGIRKVQVQRLLAWVVRALDEAARDRAWRFEAAEIAFGPGQKWPPVEVDGTWYAGRLDRLDRSRSSSALRVVDYKRSTVTAKLKLQLPIYAIAAECNDPRHGHADQGVYLVPRRAGGSTGLKVVKFDTSATDQVRESIVPTLARLRAGDVAPRPHTPTECRQCDARGVCRRPPFRVQELP